MMIECLSCGVAGFALGGAIIGVAVHYCCTKKAVRRENERLEKIKADLDLHGQEIDMLLDKVVSLNRDFSLVKKGF